jgi:signal transduction histidine kinase
MAIEQTVLLVSDNPELCAAARREFASTEDRPRVSAVRSVDAARRIMEEARPAVILLEYHSIFAALEGSTERKLRLNSVVSALAVHAPVVVIGGREQQTELGPLLASGAADFIERTDHCLGAALEQVERRLRHSPAAGKRAPVAPPTTDSPGDQAFGEILRHELNNPLTGILGNAELLLAEVRRNNDGTLPRGGQQRLETIAALAVRLRETVRRLSQDWEARGQVPQ